MERLRRMVLAESDCDGAVVAAGELVEDFGIDEAVGQTLRDEEIVDAPSDVLGSRAETVAPP